MQNRGWEDIFWFYAVAGFQLYENNLFLRRPQSNKLKFCSITFSTKVTALEVLILPVYTHIKVITRCLSSKI